jgi:hypothetical protein
MDKEQSVIEPPVTITVERAHTGESINNVGQGRIALRRNDPFSRFYQHLT